MIVCFDKFIFLIPYIIYVDSQAEPPEGGCLICGNGKVVGKPEGIFVFPGQASIACGTLENAGLNGLIPLEQCSFLSSLLRSCECGLG